jgi:antitoxin ParD1/3/4
LPTRNVVLTDRHEKLIADLVSSGRYQNASEILRDGLRLIEERDRREAAKLQALREAAQLGIDAIERGEYKEFDSFEELDDYIVAITDPIIYRSSPKKE